MGRPPRAAASRLAMLLLAACMAGCSGTSDSTAVVAEGPQDQPDQLQLPSSPEQSQPAPSPTGNPSVEFDAAQTVINTGDTVALTWSADNVSGCAASGGWSGSRPVSGSATVGPLDESTTFTLSCSGSAGNAMAMLSVSVLGVVSLSWQAPTENIDGSPLTDLAGYRIYYGSDSRNYTDQVSVDGVTTTRRDVVLASGSYYFAMTAMDGDGNESGYSNEVVKVVN